MRPTSLILASLLIAGSGFAWESDDEKLDVVSKYLDATKVQQEALRGCQMDVDIDAKLPKQEKQGRLRALRIVSRLGKIIYRPLGFSGDNTVKQEVIARYLSAETEARDNGSIAVTPANYKFRLKAKMSQGDQVTYIFQITPRKKKVGLFKGELWLDAATGMPVREAGELVKTPSIFLKKVEFVREYSLQDGVAVPAHIESTVDTRGFGRAELSINFSNYTRQVQDADTETDAAAR